VDKLARLSRLTPVAGRNAKPKHGNDKLLAPRQVHTLRHDNRHDRKDGDFYLRSRIQLRNGRLLRRRGQRVALQGDQKSRPRKMDASRQVCWVLGDSLILQDATANTKTNDQHIRDPPSHAGIQPFALGRKASQRQDRHGETPAPSVGWTN